MLCTNGHNNVNDAKFCETCGVNTFQPGTTGLPTYAATPAANATGRALGNPNNAYGLAVASLVLGIIGITVLGFAGIIGLICARLSLRTISKNERGYGMAMAGQILGGLAVAAWIILAILWRR
jgi:Domain of unknown function (DUF4190)